MVLTLQTAEIILCNIISWNLYNWTLRTSVTRQELETSLISSEEHDKWIVMEIEYFLLHQEHNIVEDKSDKKQNA